MDRPLPKSLSCTHEDKELAKRVAKKESTCNATSDNSNSKSNSSSLVSMKDRPRAHTAVLNKQESISDDERDKQWEHENQQKSHVQTGNVWFDRTIKRGSLIGSETDSTRWSTTSSSPLGASIGHASDWTEERASSNGSFEYHKMPPLLDDGGNDENETVDGLLLDNSNDSDNIVNGKIGDYTGNSKDTGDSDNDNTNTNDDSSNDNKLADNFESDNFESDNVEKGRSGVLVTRAATVTTTTTKKQHDESTSGKREQNGGFHYEQSDEGRSYWGPQVAPGKSTVLNRVHQWEVCCSWL